MRKASSDGHSGSRSDRRSCLDYRLTSDCADVVPKAAEKRAARGPGGGFCQRLLGWSDEKLAAFFLVLGNQRCISGRNAIRVIIFDSSSSAGQHWGSAYGRCTTVR